MASTWWPRTSPSTSPCSVVSGRQPGRYRDLTVDQVAAYARDVRPAGILQHWTNRHTIAVIAGVPVATSQLVGTRAECRALLADTVRAPGGPGPRFVSIGILAWSMTP